MAKPKGENDSAIPVWKSRRQKTWKNIWIVILIIMISLILAGGVVGSLIYAMSKGVVNIFLDYYSDVLNSAILLLWSAEGVGIYLFKSNVFNVKKPGIGVGVTVFLLYLSLYVIALSGWMKIQSEVTKPPELISIVDTKMEGELGEGEDGIEDEIPPSGLRYQKVQYFFSEDPFVEELSAYYGVEKNSISEDEIIDKKADLIYEDMKKLMDAEGYDNTIPEGYVWNTEHADLQYETYKIQRERDWNAGSDFMERQEWRLMDLANSEAYREAADGFHRDSSNIKAMALYSLDRGDEHARCAEMVQEEARQVEERDKMCKAYREGAEKCMDAIYAAAEKGDKKGMKDALSAFEKISVAAKDDPSIAEMYQVYKEVVKRW